jgi:hypothetical protein
MVRLGRQLPTKDQLLLTGEQQLLVRQLLLPREQLLSVRSHHTSEDLWTNYEQAKSWLRCKVGA